MGRPALVGFEAPRDSPAPDPPAGAAGGAEGLSVKQAAFVAAFLDNGFNATRAALVAGYSENAPVETGYRLLRTPAVAKVIEQALA